MVVNVRIGLSISKLFSPGGANGRRKPDALINKRKPSQNTAGACKTLRIFPLRVS
jgi:hypothetical protein